MTHTTLASLVALSSVLALAACGDDTSGAGGSGGGAGGSTSTETTTSSDGGGTTTSTTDATTTTSQGGSTSTGTGGAGAEFLPIWENISFPEDGGRVDIEAFEDLTLQVRVAGTETVALELPGVGLADGQIVHAYAIGLLADESLDALLVLDNDGVEAPSAGTSNVRLGHLVPDAPAVDVCLVDAEGGLIGPLFGDDSFAFPAISTYVELPMGTYDAIIVLAGDDCDAGIATFEGLEVPDGVYSTVAATGTLGDDTFGLTQYVDDFAAPEAGSGAITFVHTAPDAPAVDLGALL